MARAHNSLTEFALQLRDKGRANKKALSTIELLEEVVGERLNRSFQKTTRRILKTD